MIIKHNVTFQKDDVPWLVSMWLNNVTNETNPDQTNAIVKPNNAPGPAINTQPSPAPLPLAQNNNPDTTVNGLWQSTHQHTKSTYIQLLWHGEGTHNGRGGNPIIPKGIQTTMVKGVEGGHALTAWELDDKNAVFALLAGNAEAEGLEPMTIEEAKMRPDWLKWEEVINAELKSLDDARTWNMVERPKNTNVVSCKWVFKIKKNAAGEIDKYKARLVAHGFTQQYGVNYHETYALVAWLALLRLILAIAAHHDWDIDVFDFHSTFLSGKLDDNEVIYMELPPGFNKQGRNCYDPFFLLCKPLAKYW